MADGVYIDAQELSELGASIERLGSWGLSLKISGELAKQADKLATRAREIVYQYPGDQSGGTTEQVAESIHARPLTEHAWAVEAGGGPLAGLWEEGNKGSALSDPTFRHPVFGNTEVWVDQQKWPYLSRAVEELGPIVERELEDAIVETVGVYLEPAFAGPRGAKVGRSTLGTFLPIGPY